MANRQSFGRRVQPQQPAPRASAAGPEPAPASSESDWAGHDEELEDWKRARKGRWRMPWRQLSLMASLCFGVASFVLPASVNSNVQWLLYILMGAGLYAGFHKRRAS